MFERFTDRARRVVVLAQHEARLLNHNYIGTEHVLLGLIHEGEGVAGKALEVLSISLDAVREQVEDIIGQGGSAPPEDEHIPFTPRAKKVLELSLREALDLGHNYIGTEHILLGLIREGEGVAAQLLTKLGAELPRVRQTVIQLLSGYGVPSTDSPSTSETAPSDQPSQEFSSLTASSLELAMFDVGAYFGDISVQTPIYIGCPAAGSHPLKFQAAWLSSQRAVVIPGDLMDSLARLRSTADGRGLTVYELVLNVKDEEFESGEEIDLSAMQVVPRE